MSILLVQGFRENHENVLVIEEDENNPGITRCRELGALVLVGNSSDMKTLQKAHVERAKYAIAVCEGDATNAEFAVGVQKILGVHMGQTPVTCAIHLTDPGLHQRIRKLEMNVPGDTRLRMEFFNVFDRGVKRLLNNHPIDEGNRAAAESPPHPLVVGCGQLSEKLVFNAAVRWLDDHPTLQERLPITLLDGQATQKKALWLLRYPHLDTICELEANDIELETPTFERAGFLRDVTAIYVCIEDETQALSAALTLHKKTSDDIPIVVCTKRETGIAGLLCNMEEADKSFFNLHIFGMEDNTCTPELITGGTHEMLAQQIHELFVRNEEKKGLTQKDNPNICPWEELEDNKKESNRGQVDDILSKLRRIHCGIEPLTSLGTLPSSFSDEEVDVLAKREYNRWKNDLLKDDWTDGEIRDDDKKIHPLLQYSWEELSEDEKDKNREIIRDIPPVLRRAGFQIYRR